MALTLSETHFTFHDRAPFQASSSGWTGNNTTGNHIYGVFLFVQHANERNGNSPAFLPGITVRYGNIA